MPSSAVTVEDEPFANAAAADESPKEKRGSQTSKALLLCQQTIDELKEEFLVQGEKKYEMQKQALELNKQFMEKVLANQEAARQQREDKNNILREILFELNK